MSSISKKYFLCFVFALACGIVSGLNYQSHPLEPEITSETYLLDPTNTFTYEEVKTKPFTDSKESAEELLLKLNSKRSIWGKLIVKNPGNQIFMGAIYSNASAERVYYWTEDNEMHSRNTGLLNPDQRHVGDRNQFSLPITLEPGESRTYYFKTREFIRYLYAGQLFFNIHNIHIPDEIIEPPGQSFLDGIQVFFNGLLVFQLFYILLQWFLVRRSEYLYYALYTLTLFAYFWPRFAIEALDLESMNVFISHFTYYFNDVLLIIPIFFYFRFCRLYIDLPRHNPKWNRVIKYFEYSFLALAGVVFLTNVVIPNDLPKNAIILTAISLQFLMSGVALRFLYDVKLVLTRFILTAGVIAITAHVIAMAITVFRVYTYIDISPLSITITAIIIEIAIFNSGLLYKARQVEVDKLSAEMTSLKELQARQKIDLEYAGVRDRIARDLHDDVGSTLSSVSIYSYAAKEKLEKGEISKVKELLVSIEKNALSTLNSMGDLVWAINPNNDSAEKLIQRITNFGYEILSAKDCSMHVTTHPEFYNLKLSLEQRRSILLICKEAINNTAKYAEACNLELEIAQCESGFTIKITDDGVGFDPDTVAAGTGLPSMKARAATLSDVFEIRSKKGETYISFHVNTSRTGAV